MPVKLKERSSNLRILPQNRQYLACNPIDPDAMPLGEFGFDLDIEDNGDAFIDTNKIVVDVGKATFGPEEVRRALRDAQIFADAIQRDPDAVCDVVGLYQTAPLKAAQRLEELHLSEADFLARGGGAFSLFLLVVVVVAAGCASVDRTGEDESALGGQIDDDPLPPPVIQDCGFESNSMTVPVTGFGRGRSRQKAIERANANFNFNLTEELKIFQRQLNLQCRPPCRPVFQFTIEGEEEPLTFDGSNPRGLFLRLNRDGKFGFGLLPGGRQSATKTRDVTISVACVR